jgi:hypothetical protein
VQLSGGGASPAVPEQGSVACPSDPLGPEPFASHRPHPPVGYRPCSFATLSPAGRLPPPPGTRCPKIHSGACPARDFRSLRGTRLRHGPAPEFVFLSGAGGRVVILARQPNPVNWARLPAAGLRPRQPEPNFSAAKSLQNTDRAGSWRLDGDRARHPGRDPVRRVGGRIFLPRGEIWTGWRQANRIPVTAIAAFSPAYLELVRMLPEIAPLLSVGDRIVIAGRRGSVGRAPSGIERWSPGQLDARLRNFRGT